MQEMEPRYVPPTWEIEEDIQLLLLSERMACQPTCKHNRQFKTLYIFERENNEKTYFCRVLQWIHKYTHNVCQLSGNKCSLFRRYRSQTTITHIAENTSVSCRRPLTSATWWWWWVIISRRKYQFRVEALSYLFTIAVSTSLHLIICRDH